MWAYLTTNSLEAARNLLRKSFMDALQIDSGDSVKSSEIIRRALSTQESYTDLAMFLVLVERLRDDEDCRTVVGENWKGWLRGMKQHQVFGWWVNANYSADE
jgi:hypothetical protein